MANGAAGVVRTRRDVYNLADWDPILLWYAKAVTDLSSRPVTDPTSWRYQAAIHGYDPAQDPFATPGEALPSPADQKQFWSQCQHFSWFFLPWHRMYLFYFEQIVLASIIALGGPADWALPYWNYSDTRNPNARKLPPAFRATTLPDGTANPLLVSERDPAILAGGSMSATAVGLRCLRDTIYTGGGSGGTPGFGGPKTQFSHVGNVTGGLETTPHGDVHVAVGGASVGGWMFSFETAALDPIFWLHHSNIDRLWQVWRGRNPRFVNPTDHDWLAARGATFRLHDAAGAVITLTPSQVVDTTVAPLDYDFEDVSDPLAPPARAVLMSAQMTQPTHPPEMVGALPGVDLNAAPTTAEVALAPPQGPAASMLAAGHPTRVFLNLENVTSQGAPGSYAVYLNLPQGSTDPQGHDELFAGTLPMFGVREATRTTSEHGGGGLTYVLDVTEVVDTLKAAGAWDPAKLRVTLTPVSAAAAGATARVGRISLFYH